MIGEAVDESRDDASGTLALRIAAGDANAERELYARFARGLRFVIRRRVAAPDRVDDVLQETFLIALGKLRRGELLDPAALPGFLHGIALNVVSTLERGGGRERARIDASGDAALEWIASSAPGPETALDLSTLTALVAAVLADMAIARDREILWRHYVIEEDKASICSRLALDAAHYDRVLFRARGRLRDAIKRRGIDPDGELSA